MQPIMERIQMMICTGFIFRECSLSCSKQLFWCSCMSQFEQSGKYYEIFCKQILNLESLNLFLLRNVKAYLFACPTGKNARSVLLGLNPSALTHDEPYQYVFLFCTLASLFSASSFWLCFLLVLPTSAVWRSVSWLARHLSGDTAAQALPRSLIG